MIIDNCATERIEVLQSYIVTTARYNFNVYEKRILYRIVEMTQHLLQGKKLNQRYRIDKQLFDLYDVEIPLTALLNGEDDTHYSRTKAALQSMSRKFFQYEDEKEWREIPLILLPKIKKYESTVTFRMHEDIYNALLNFSKGFKKYELQTAFTFESAYAMRFYELMSKQRTPLIYSVKDLKIMFGVEKKYKLTADFIRRVIDSAQKELNEKSPYSFEYTSLKKGRAIVSMKFYPTYIAKNLDENFEGQQLKKQQSPAWTIDRAILNYLKEHYMLSTPEIKNNIDLFETAQKMIPDLLMFLSEVKAKAKRANNPKGYLINSLRKKLKIKTEKTEKNHIKKEPSTGRRGGEPKPIGKVMK